MELIIDFMLLAVSGAAAFYCLMLSRKLEKLKDTEKGLGATIATMSATVDQARGAVLIAKESSAESIAELSPLIKETREILPKLEEMVDVISELSEIAINDLNEASSAATEKLDATVATARALQDELSDTATKLKAIVAVDEPQDEDFGQVVDLDGMPADLEERDPPASRVDDAIKKARDMQRMKKAAG